MAKFLLLVIPKLRDRERFDRPSYTFCIYPKYWNILMTYHTCPKFEQINFTTCWYAQKLEQCHPV